MNTKKRFFNTVVFFLLLLVLFNLPALSKGLNQIAYYPSSSTPTPMPAPVNPPTYPATTPVVVATPPPPAVPSSTVITSETFCCYDHVCMKKSDDPNECSGKTEYASESECLLSSECNCASYCIESESGYYFGHNITPSSQCPSDNDHAVVDNCCCKKCPIDDYKCHCNKLAFTTPTQRIGSDTSIMLAGESFINMCCPFLSGAITGLGPGGTDLVFNPPVSYLVETPMGAECGQCVNCTLANMCGMIEIGVCSCFTNICEAAIHETLHHINCLLGQQTQNQCDAKKAHIIIAKQVYEQCKSIQQLDPNFYKCGYNCTDEHIKRYCSEYCQSIPFSNGMSQSCYSYCNSPNSSCHPTTVSNATVNSICQSVGINCSQPAPPPPPQPTPTPWPWPSTQPSMPSFPPFYPYNN